MKQEHMRRHELCLDGGRNVLKITATKKTKQVKEFVASCENHLLDLLGMLTRIQDLKLKDCLRFEWMALLEHPLHPDASGIRKALHGP